MIKYGSDTIRELRFESFQERIEVRDRQWVDIELRFVLAADTPGPDDLIDLTALVITNTEGRIAQIVPQDEGIDCDYQFTFSEKEQLAAFVNGDAMQQKIAKRVSQSADKLW
ncbi:hypothetical protein BG53_03450 [Paenibacillus darwinianus]|uniref:Uncharacterized protein n=1 Tax=Paenibacillus darwinianus TaxID=1380763 RepID=A0A9W5S1I2_9BACL|nr:hypothetical protein [Paenibacillus darwinianus]EXX87763.1 hypothetical protein BG53_03450 [Paenibacillus darwinianus]EXX89915.1 hypothetical protein BG52_14440 [Paenibacillus darwinianus]EXX90756.1 hypothetical protein CH50_14795 [Paenibacillus darwinianus]